MQKHNLSTLLHLLELAVAGLIAVLLALAAKYLFDIEMSEMLTGIIGLLFAGMAKYARVSPSVGVGDYVNPVDTKEKK